MKKLTKVILIVFLFWSMVFGLWSISYAAIPHLLNYQGRLTDSQGKLIADGAYNITFRIYDLESGGVPLWEEQQSVQIAKGIFNALLGGVNNLNLAFDKPYWLEIKVGSDAAMSPRQRIASVGYAIRAERLVDEPLPAARGGTGSTAAANTASGVVVLNASSQLPAVSGALLTAFPSTVKATIGIDSGSGVTGDIKFNFTFASAPVVVACFREHAPGMSDPILWVYNVTTTGFRCLASEGQTGHEIYWIAIGTK